MSSQPLTPPAPPSPGEFRPENFKKKSTARDYLIYAAVLVIVIGLIGGSVYYFTRSKAEKDELQAKLDQKMNEAGLRSDAPPPPTLKAPKLDGLLGEEPAEAKQAEAVAKKAEPKAVAVSTYSGGGPNRVLLSDAPDLPKASLAFIQFAEVLRVSSVVQGNPAKVMIAGKLFRSGDVIDAVQGVTFVGVDGVKTALILRDQKGAELRVTY